MAEPSSPSRPEPTGPEPTGPEPTGPELTGPEPAGPEPAGPSNGVSATGASSNDASAKSSTVVVAVLTYRRPDDLTAVLPMLVGQTAALGTPARVLVVDNDPAGGARELVAGFDVQYAHEPTPGIAAARNRALAEASGDDVLVFIDDDERPDDGWLAALVATYRATGADAVVGPVSSVFEGELDPWIAEGGFFTRRRLATGTRVEVAATNNLLLDLHSVRARQLAFDPALGLIGGEDTLFTRQLGADGGRLVWCAEAMVTDVVPADRMTRRFVLERAYHYGCTAAAVELRLAGSAQARMRIRVRNSAQGLVRVLGGLARFLLGVLTLTRSRRAAGARNLARGLGLLVGATGRMHAHYTR